MFKKQLDLRRLAVSVSGAVSGRVLKNHGDASKIHMSGIVLEASGVGVMTLRDKFGGSILQKTFSATDKFLNIDAEIFGGGGRLMMDVSTAITITGTIMYWKEDLGRSPIKSA
jgi:hypothetical protein